MIAILKSLLEGIYILAHFLEPVLPRAMSKVFQRLNTKPTEIFDLKDDWNNLIPGTSVILGDALFPRLDKTRNDKKLEAQLLAQAQGTAQTQVKPKKSKQS